MSDQEFKVFQNIQKLLIQNNHNQIDIKKSLINLNESINSSDFHNSSLDFIADKLDSIRDVLQRSQSTESSNMLNNSGMGIINILNQIQHSLSNIDSKTSNHMGF